MTNFERTIGRMNLRKADTSPAKPARDELHDTALSANHIDLIIAVFALGVVLGAVIT